VNLRDRQEQNARIRKLASEEKNIGLQNEKLRLELHGVHQENSPRAKLSKGFREWMTALSGLAFASTIAVGILTVRSNYTEQAETRFDHAVQRLASVAVRERLTGITALAGFINAGGDHARQSLLLLVRVIMTEDDAIVREALSSAIIIAASNSKTDEATRKEALKLLIVNSRNRGVGDCRTRSSQPDEIGYSIAALLKSIGESADLSGIVCRNCDFSEIQKLSGGHFDGAILDGAKFDGSVLTGTSFDGASLLGASFKKASLTGARFTDTRRKDWAACYVEQTGSFPRPIDFRGADLENARFSGSIIIGVEEADFKGLIQTWSFRADRKTNLERAHFEDLRMYAVRAIPSSQYSPADLEASPSLAAPFFFEIEKVQLCSHCPPRSGNASGGEPDLVYVVTGHLPVGQRPGIGNFRESLACAFARISQSESWRLAIWPDSFRSLRDEIYSNSQTSCPSFEGK
jgi:uncharacterized protein YjbI with pentapeptide repeats